MPNCELCGKDTPLVSADIEGADLEVCMNCAQHGTIKRKPSLDHFPSRVRLPELPEEVVVSNFASTLRGVREKRGMTQEDFAKLLREKESMLVKWESGLLQPEVAVAKKIGKILGLSFVELEKAEPLPRQQQKNDVLTLGDVVIKVRKKKG